MCVCAWKAGFICLRVLAAVHSRVPLGTWVACRRGTRLSPRRVKTKSGEEPRMPHKLHSHAWLYSGGITSGWGVEWGRVRVLGRTRRLSGDTASSPRLIGGGTIGEGLLAREGGLGGQVGFVDWKQRRGPLWSPWLAGWLAPIPSHTDFPATGKTG